MSSYSAKVTFDFSVLDEIVEEIVSDGLDLMAEMIVDNIRKPIETWPADKAETIKERVAQHFAPNPSLIRTGAMLKRVALDLQQSKKVEGNKGTITTNDVVAIANNTGTRTIPAREFIIFNDAEQQQITDAMLEGLVKRWQARLK